MPAVPAEDYGTLCLLLGSKRPIGLGNGLQRGTVLSREAFDCTFCLFYFCDRAMVLQLEMEAARFAPRQGNHPPLLCFERTRIGKISGWFEAGHLAIFQGPRMLPLGETG